MWTARRIVDLMIRLAVITVLTITVWKLTIG
jgi:hypothetical protein